MTPSDEDGVYVQPQEMRYDLTHEEIFGYLDMVAPNGVVCQVCGVNHWTASFVPVDVGSANAPHIEMRALPDGDRGIQRLPENSDSVQSGEWALGFRGKTYSYLCGNCGHTLSFSAPVVAARLAIKRRPA